LKRLRPAILAWRGSSRPKRLGIRREIAGIRAILVHAISERARQFYEEWGFVASPVDPMTLRIAVTEAAREFVEKSR
jgi:hypothetical protein